MLPRVHPNVTKRNNAEHAPPPSLSYKVDTSRPSLRTNWTRLVPFAQVQRNNAEHGGRAGSGKWTRRVPHPVLIGHDASLAPY